MDGHGRAHNGSREMYISRRHLSQQIAPPLGFLNKPSPAYLETGLHSRRGRRPAPRVDLELARHKNVLARDARIPDRPVHSEGVGMRCRLAEGGFPLFCNVARRVGHPTISASQNPIIPAHVFLVMVCLGRVDVPVA